jgi:hypothetical protein
VSSSAASPLTPWEQERIPVAAERPGRRPPARVGVVDATDAGLTFIVVLVLLAAGGAVAGGMLGLSISGAILGATVGLPAAFAATYLRYKKL